MLQQRPKLILGPSPNPTIPTSMSIPKSIPISTNKFKLTNESVSLIFFILLIIVCYASPLV